MWKAASYNGEDIDEGKIVRIVGIDGNKLLVEPVDEL
jgi:membrane protein implicated in regulation of membrane protease activity